VLPLNFLKTRQHRKIRVLPPLDQGKLTHDPPDGPQSSTAAWISPAAV